MDLKLIAGAAGSPLGDSAAAATMGVDTSCLPSLTMKQRTLGFAACFGTGIVISVLSTLSLASPVRCVGVGLVVCV